MNSQDSTPGEIVTFYSYNGGTGRSMSLVNLAYLLADKLPDGQKILLLDWDLDAPGLHRYFHDRLRVLQSGKNGNVDAVPGLIDLFCLMKQAAEDKSLQNQERQEWTPLEAIDLDDFILGTCNPNLHIIKAGLIDDGYSTRVNTFDWEGFCERFPSIFLRFAEKLKSRYRYIFIDSRTGQTDAAGICTALMPEKLVTVFTPNRQSLLGMEAIIRQAIAYRNASEEDKRPLLVFPLPSRVEVTQDELCATWRFGSKARHIEGYEPFFVRVLSDVYGLTYCHLKKYFDEVQIRQNPVYAFGEEIAVLIEKSKEVEDDYSLTPAYKNLLDWLEPGFLPWQHPELTLPLSPSPTETSPPSLALAKPSNSIETTFDDPNAMPFKQALCHELNLSTKLDAGQILTALDASPELKTQLSALQRATLNTPIPATIHGKRHIIEHVVTTLYLRAIVRTVNLDIARGLLSDTPGLTVTTIRNEVLISILMAALFGENRKIYLGPKLMDRRVVKCDALISLDGLKTPPIDIDGNPTHDFVLWVSHLCDENDVSLATIAKTDYDYFFEQTKMNIERQRSLFGRHFRFIVSHDKWPLLQDNRNCAKLYQALGIPITRIEAISNVSIEGVFGVPGHIIELFFKHFLEILEQARQTAAE
jgi:cellulose biosynthesis protein BcsQ